MTITKKDLEEILDKKLDNYQSSLVEAVDWKLQKVSGNIDYKLQKMEERMDEKYAKESSIRELKSLLEDFLKQLFDHKEEFAIMKAKMDQVKQALKEKLGIEIAVQR